tara:strand:+ start:10028 stop:10939 length:912 start_codon:yes stop_codon:yes gene_type:complete
MDKLIIKANTYGFASSFMETLDNLLYCDKNKIIPIMGWSDESNYYDSNDNNVWEYYFEPVLPDDITEKDLMEIQSNIWKYPDYKETSGIRLLTEIPNHFGLVKTICEDEPMNDNHRKLANQIIEKYIKINSFMSKRIADFYDKNFLVDSYKVGVHIRGGTYYTEIINAKENLNLEYYKNKLDEVIKFNSDKKIQIYLATDSNEAVEYIKSNFDNVISQNCQRIPHYYIKDGFIDMGNIRDEFSRSLDRRKLGEEVLMDIKLLSMCDCFVHYESGVSVVTAYFNPNLKLFHVLSMNLFTHRSYV